MELYLNELPIDSDFYAGGCGTTNLEPILIGSGVGRPFPGLIDDVRIYDSADAGIQLALDYANPPAPSPSSSTPPVAPISTAMPEPMSSTLSFIGLIALSTQFWRRCPA